MSSKVFEKKYETSNPNFKASITIREQGDGRFLTYGKLQDSNGNTVPKSRVVRRCTKSLQDAKRQITGLCNAISGMIPSEVPLDSPKKNTRKPNNVIDTLVQEMFDAKEVFYTAEEAGSKKASWNEKTHRTVYTYWLNHGFSDLLSRMDASEDPSHELEVFREQLIQETIDHGRSLGARARAAETVNTHLKRCNILRKHLCKLHSEIPPYDLTNGVLFGRAVPEEQVKELPEELCRYITRELEVRIIREPKEVLCAVLMYDAALRTAEAAGIRIDCIIIYENYAVIAVKCQEKDGVRTDKLKTDNSYRMVVTSYWAKEMICRCLEVLGLDPNDDCLLLRGEHLSRWIRNIMISYSANFVETAEQIQRTNPDYDEDGKPIYDIPAYVFRRNAASRWLNYDGLTHDEIDILLGHKEKDQRPDIYLLDETHQREIAGKLERYVYNPNITRNPAYCPLQLAPGNRIDLKAYPRTRLVNTSDVPLHVHIDIVACMPDEVIAERVPAGSTEDPICRSERLKPASRIVIHSNLKTFDNTEDFHG